MTIDEIKQLRKSHGWTQQDLAMEMGMSMSTIARWELGLSHPSPLAEKELRKLAKRAFQEKSDGH